ncbi:DUF3742 family protein [Acidovorax sp. SUPP2539]|uniref:DUF3742 family protein n=1 Tax=Acidovorax sp. SUPP2539 TaxID=2920878 RepID=UPI0023DE2048|nr:DUF3742 family protein [Acidovorax sp. SUPP2539]GKS92685.1 DUF3742 family protein [Acidovorax sp. SUPP2539]
MHTSQSKVPLSRRAGRAAARAWRWLLRQDRGINTWLVARWAPQSVARIVGWCLRLVVVATLFYVAAWMAALVLMLAAGCWLAANATDALDEDDEPPQWRNGLLGFGFYDKNGVRIDPYDPTDPN